MFFSSFLSYYCDFCVIYYKQILLNFKKEGFYHARTVSLLLPQMRSLRLLPAGTQRGLPQL